MENNKNGLTRTRKEHKNNTKNVEKEKKKCTKIRKNADWI